MFCLRDDSNCRPLPLSIVKVVVIMAAAWVTNFFISVHPLLEAVFYQSDTLKTSPFVSEMKPEKIPFMSEQQENDDPPECKYALNQLKCVDLPSGAYFCELETSKCLTRGTMHVSYSFIFVWFSIARASLFVWLGLYAWLSSHRCASVFDA